MSQVVWAASVSTTWQIGEGTDNTEISTAGSTGQEEKSRIADQAGSTVQGAESKAVNEAGEEDERVLREGIGLICGTSA